jgi:TolA-binding protein
MTDVRRWELLADAAAVDDRLPEDDARFVQEFDDLDAHTERDVYDTLAQLGRPSAASEQDLSTARSLLVARTTPARGRRWAIALGVAAAAAILAVAIGLPTAMSWTRDEGTGLSAGGLLTDMEAGEKQVRDAAAAARPAVPSSPEVAPVPDEAAPDEIEIFDEGESASEPERPRPSRTQEPPASAGELLARARKLVLTGSEAKALAVYEKLRRAHPSSSEAHVANVSMGEIQLQRGKASAALAAFDRYLAGGGGSLREEALWGRVRALHRLGRVEARDEAAARLRKTFPKSVYLSRLPD